MDGKIRAVMKFKFGFNSKRAFDPHDQKRTDPIMEMIKSNNEREDTRVYTKKEAFPLPFIGEYVPRGLAEWKMHHEFKYVDEDSTKSVTVPVYDPNLRFLTDGASIPPIAYLLIGSPWRGKYVEAAIIHDWECFLAKTLAERKAADKKFKKMLGILGVALWKRKLMYRGVRMGAWWNKKKIIAKGK